jgi:aromatic-L-amino-acid decarboxylase
LAPVPFSTICFRYRPAALAANQDEPDVAEELDRLNIALIDAINRSGEVFLSHTRLRGRFTIRIALANLRTEDADLDRVWQVIRREAAALAAAPS